MCWSHCYTVLQPCVGSDVHISLILILTTCMLMEIEDTKQSGCFKWCGGIDHIWTHILAILYVLLSIVIIIYGWCCRWQLPGFREGSGDNNTTLCTDNKNLSPTSLLSGRCRGIGSLEIAAEQVSSSCILHSLYWCCNAAIQTLYRCFVFYLCPPPVVTHSVLCCCHWVTGWTSGP